MTRVKEPAEQDKSANILELDKDFVLKAEGGYRFGMLNDQVFVIISQNNGISYATEYFVDFNKQKIFKKFNNPPFIVLHLLTIISMNFYRMFQIFRKTLKNIRTTKIIKILK